MILHDVWGFKNWLPQKIFIQNRKEGSSSTSTVHVNTVINNYDIGEHTFIYLGWWKSLIPFDHYGYQLFQTLCRNTEWRSIWKPLNLYTSKTSNIFSLFTKFSGISWYMNTLTVTLSFVFQIEDRTDNVQTKGYFQSLIQFTGKASSFKLTKDGLRRKPNSFLFWCWDVIHVMNTLYKFANLRWRNIAFQGKIMKLHKVSFFMSSAGSNYLVRLRKGCTVLSCYMYINEQRWKIPP